MTVTPMITGAPVPLDVLTDPAAAVDAYTAWLGRTGLAANSKRTYIGQVHGFLRWLVGQDQHRLDEVFTDPHTRDYAVRDYRRWMLTEAKRAPKGVDAAVTAIAGMYEWVGLGRPAVRAAAPRFRRAPRALDEAQTRAALRAAERRGRRDLAIVATAIGTGLRVSELAALDTDDAWVSARKGAVQVRAGKGDQPRTVPLNSQTREAMSSWLSERGEWAGPGFGPLFITRSGARLAVRSIRHVVDQVGVAAGIELAPHVLRHTFATRLLREGVDVSTVAELMGHASLDTTLIYTRPTVADTETAVEKLTVDY